MRRSSSPLRAGRMRVIMRCEGEDWQDRRRYARDRHLHIHSLPRGDAFDSCVVLSKATWATPSAAKHASSIIVHLLVLNVVFAHAPRLLLAAPSAVAAPSAAVPIVVLFLSPTAPASFETIRQPPPSASATP